LSCALAIELFEKNVHGFGKMFLLVFRFGKHLNQLCFLWDQSFDFVPINLRHHDVSSFFPPSKVRQDFFFMELTSIYKPEEHKRRIESTEGAPIDTARNGGTP
jgi:hypothetical protein